jgi:hypothetical protein
MEAAIGGVPGIAFSLHTPTDNQGILDYTAAGRIAHRIVSKIRNNVNASSLLLNVNIPYLPEEEIKGIVVTRQGLRVYRDRLDRRLDPRGRPYFWIGGDAPTAIPDEGTDFGALEKGFVSITPLHLDMTTFSIIHGRLIGKRCKFLILPLTCGRFAVKSGGMEYKNNTRMDKARPGALAPVGDFFISHRARVALFFCLQVN